MIIVVASRQAINSNLSPLTIRVRLYDDGLLKPNCGGVGISKRHAVR